MNLKNKLENKSKNKRPLQSLPKEQEEKRKKGMRF